MAGADFQRARTPEQVDQRRSQILRAAALVLEDEGADGVTLNRIARGAGIAKSNIYRYFESREAILLSLVSSDWTDFSAAMEQQLSGLAGSNDADAVARVIASGFRSRPRFCELNSVVSLTLEGRVSEGSMQGFRSRVGELGLRLANGVHAALPRIPRIRCIWAIGMFHGMAAGLWPMTTARARPAEGSELQVFGRAYASFGENLEAAIRALLYGLLVEAARGSR
jgi:AcrR family transcriptional regulator